VAVEMHIMGRVSRKAKTVCQGQYLIMAASIQNFEYYNRVLFSNCSSQIIQKIVKMSRQKSSISTYTILAATVSILVLLSLLLPTSITIAQEEKLELKEEEDEYEEEDDKLRPSPKQFQPPLDTLIDFNFAALGDTNCNSITESIVEDIQAKAPEIVLGLGDYIYNDDEAGCWLEIVEPIDKYNEDCYRQS
jgi:hypothetical protein